MAKLILFNANVITLDERMPKARLVVIDNGKIQSVSTDNNLNDYKEKNSVIIDCHKKTLLPGFIDAHFHFHAFVDSLLALDLSPGNNIKSIFEIKNMIQEKAAQIPSGSWIKGKGYNEFYLAEKRHPNRRDLDEASSSHPIKLTHRSGHAHVLNSIALKLVGISRQTPDPPGGFIDRDLVNGDPTGLLYEMGHFLSKRIPLPDPDDFDRAAKKADQTLLSLGITSIHDASANNSLDQWNSFKSFKEQGLVNCRITMMKGLEAFDKYSADHFISRLSPDQLQTCGVKIILDQSTGSLFPPQKELNAKVKKIHEAGQQVIIHAIEETAVDSACSAIENAIKHFPQKDHRHRIEHCSICPPSLARRLAAAGIMVVSQPSFLYYNGDRYLKTISPQQRQYLYPFNLLIKHNVNIAGSTDCPIVPANPFIGIYCAITRLCETGNVLEKKERLSVMEAMQMHTIWAAKSFFKDTVTGSITPEKLADLILTDIDPTSIPFNEIKNIQVEMTICDGNISYNSK